MSCYSGSSVLPDDYPIGAEDDPDRVLCRGASVIASPLGEILPAPEIGGEAVLRAELDLGQIAEGKYDFDVTGHYARPDIFKLSINEQPMPSVVSEHQPTPRTGEPATLPVASVTTVQGGGERGSSPA